MLGFIGEYECKVDAKGRLLFPAGLRKQLSPSDNESFVINKGFENCLMLYPKSVWDVKARPINALSEFKAKNRMLKRLFFKSAKPVELDGNGRLLLSKELMNLVGLKKEVVLLAHGDEIEIWDKKEYDKIDSSNYSDLAEELLGGDSNIEE